MDYREELFKALTAGIEGTMRDKHIDALVEVCRAAWKEGYNAGLEDGHMSNGTLEEKVKEAYTNGANDAWALAKDLTLSIKYDYLTREEIFEYTDVENIFNLTGAQALTDLKEYEEEQKKPVFKVGDEVTDDGGWKGVVTLITPDGKYLAVTLQDGNAIQWKKESFKKTGRHFPQIAEVLKQMQEGDK